MPSRLPLLCQKNGNDCILWDTCLQIIIGKSNINRNNCYGQFATVKGASCPFFILGQEYVNRTRYAISIWCPSANIYNFKRQFCLQICQVARGVCDGSGVVAKSDAVAKRNASDFVIMERALHKPRTKRIF